MKIEIEYSEIERLKYEINRLENEYAKMKQMYDSIDKSAIEDYALIQTKNIVSSFFTKLSKELNLEFDKDSFEFDYRQIVRRLDRNYFQDEKFEINLSIDVSNKIKKMFLRLGLKLDKE